AMTLTMLSLQLPCFVGRAEYRAFQLQIVGSGGTQTVLTNLDPNQYADFYLAGRWDNVLMERTWMCYGRTNGLPICPPPDQGEVPAPAPPPVQ
ncbi:MAG: hypothetical protein K2X47_17405, partial [Bdellovibrionales bacterium]|nr:hypothetical protein [Bdellovibrionales bacterium]